VATAERLLSMRLLSVAIDGFRPLRGLNPSYKAVNRRMG
jgi:hypothetical protein